MSATCQRGNISFGVPPSLITVFRLRRRALSRDRSYGFAGRDELPDFVERSDLDSEEAAAKLVITIGGYPYSGKMEHHHEGEAGHDHAHGKTEK